MTAAFNANGSALVRVLGLLALVCLTACGKHDGDDKGTAVHVTGQALSFSPAPPPGIATEPVSVSDRSDLTVPGRLVWNEDRTVRVFSPFAGHVVQILVRLGDSVKAGQPLAVLSSPDYGTAQADFRKARATLALTQHALERARDLNAHGVAAAKEVEQAEADQEAAEAEMLRAQNVLRLFSDKGDGVDEHLVLRSPIAGVVVERAINPGQEIRPDTSAQPQFVVTDPTSLWVQLDARESDLPVLRPGLELSFKVGPYGERPFRGEVVRVSDYVDPTTRTMKVLGKVDNPERLLKGEMFVTATVPIDAAPHAQAPAMAVFLDGDKHYAFVHEGDSFVRREVEVGAEAGGFVSIVSGVKAGDNVVTQGALFLQQMLQKQGSS